MYCELSSAWRSLLLVNQNSSYIETLLILEPAGFLRDIRFVLISIPLIPLKTVCQELGPSGHH